MTGQWPLERIIMIIILSGGIKDDTGLPKKNETLEFRVVFTVSSFCGYSCIRGENIRFDWEVGRDNMRI